MNLVNIFNLFFQLHRMHGLKKAFTLLEVIIALTLFEFVMIGVIMAVNRAYAYVQSTKFQVMAVNLAREGVEQMYTIRDTNRRKHSAQKDMYRLLPDPMVATNSSYDATTAVIASGVYTLDVKVSSGQQYPVLSGKALIPGTTLDDLYDHFDTYGTGADRALWRIPFTGNFYSGTQILTGIQNVMEHDAEFYRIVRVYGLYLKNGSANDAALDCPMVTNAGNPDCAPTTPKELRFCVKIWYLFTSRGSTELCGVMTNFRE